MDNKPKRQAASIFAKYFSWRLFRRDGVYYADGRTNKHQLGKHSLGTRNREEALMRLKLLDQQKAAEHGLISAAALEMCSAPSIADGWRQYLDDIDSNHVMGGAT